jgi:K+-transporting ATPase c subunit
MESSMADRSDERLGAAQVAAAALIEAMARQGVASGASPSSQADAAESQARRLAAARRIAHLFRRSIQEGTINPLMHLVARHRMDALQ